MRTLCRKFGVPRWTHSYEEILSDRSIDAVIIALPHPLHVKFGLMALAAGKHVHLQKPLSTSLEEAEAFVNAAEASDRTVLCLPDVGRPHLRAARKLIAAGAIGQVSSGHARFSHGGPEVYYATIQGLLEEEAEEELWFFDAARADVGALFDMGVYAIAHLVGLMGSVRSVTCRVRDDLQADSTRRYCGHVAGFRDGSDRNSRDRLVRRCADLRIFRAWDHRKAGQPAVDERALAQSADVVAGRRCSTDVRADRLGRGP